jgi:gliding motility-associated-like protein
MQNFYVRFFTLYFILNAALGQYVFGQCQTTNWTNPSFEGTSVAHNLPANWSNCNGTTSDTQPGQWGVNVPPSNGNTYAGLVAATGWNETASQVFSPCLNAGQTYSFTIDILKVDETSDGGGDCDGSIELWGGNSTASGCDQDELLWTSPTIVTNGPNQNNWITYTMTFTPTQTTCQLTFIAQQGNCAQGIGDFYCGLDNISAIQPAITVAASATPVSCFNGNNGSVTANVTAGGTAPFTYTWNPGNIPGQTANNLAAGTYTVTVLDGAGCTITQTATVNQPAAVNINLTPTPASCGGQGSITTTISGGNGPFTYSWTPSGGNAQNPTGLAPGNYTVTVTEPGCTYTATTTISSSGGAVATFTQSPNQCLANNSFDFTNTGTQSGATYQWVFQGGTPASATTQNVTGVTYSAAGTYTVSLTVTSGTCTATTTSTVVVSASLPISITGNDTICVGSSSTLTINGAASTTYTWTPGNLNGLTQTFSPATTTTYSVNGTDVNGCTGSTTFVVNVAPTPTLNVGGFAETCAGMCDGQAVCLVTPNTGPFATYTYAWSNNSNQPSISNLCSGAYSVTVTSIAGCTATASVSITAPPAPTLTITALNPNGCAPHCVTFTGSTSLTNATCNWTFSNGQSATGNCNPNICFTNPGVYDATLVVTDAGGCTATLTETGIVTVYASPDAAFTFGPQPANEYESTVTFTDQSTGGNLNSWNWDFGVVPPTSSAQQNSMFTYNEPGNYDVTLTVTNSFGCVDSITQTVIVEQSFAFYVPNAFSPDGDGTNDEFFTKGVGINTEKFNLWIYDRWGNLIWNTNDFFKKWNGKVDGKSEIVQQDVYVWKVTLYDMSDKKRQYIGHVTVIR